MFWSLSGKEALVLVFFLVLLPGSTFFALWKSKPRLKFGFPLLVLILGLIAVPNFIRPRVVQSMNACVNNLRAIQAAKQRWAEINHKGSDDVPTMSELFNPTNGIEHTPPMCPNGGIYILGSVGEEVRCTIGPPTHTLHPPHIYSDSNGVYIQR